MRRKILSTILALCMVMSMLPMTAFAAVVGDATVTKGSADIGKITVAGKEAIVTSDESVTGKDYGDPIVLSVTVPYSEYNNADIVLEVAADATVEYVAAGNIANADAINQEGDNKSNAGTVTISGQDVSTNTTYFFEVTGTTDKDAPLYYKLTVEPGYTINGTVDAGDTNITDFSEIKVNLYKADAQGNKTGDSLKESGITDNGGSNTYTFENIPDGDYVAVINGDTSATPEYGTSASGKIVVNDADYAASDNSKITLASASVYEVSGKVIIPNTITGVTITDLEVNLYASDDTSFANPLTTAVSPDATGVYTFTAVEAGTYVAVIKGDNAKYVDSKSAEFNVSKDIAATDDGETNINLVAPTAPTATATNNLTIAEGKVSGGSITVKLANGAFEDNVGSNIIVGVGDATLTTNGATITASTGDGKKDTAVLNITWGDTAVDYGDEITVTISKDAIKDYNGEDITATTTIVDPNAATATATGTLTVAEDGAVSGTIDVTLTNDEFVDTLPTSPVPFTVILDSENMNVTAAKTDAIHAKLTVSKAAPATGSGSGASGSGDADTPAPTATHTVVVTVLAAAVKGNESISADVEGVDVNDSSVVASDDASLLKVLNQNITATGDGTEANKAKTATITVPYATEKLIAASNITVADKATAKLFGGSDFTGEGVAELPLSATETHAYILVTAEDGETVCYYDVTIKKEAPDTNAKITAATIGGQTATIEDASETTATNQAEITAELPNGTLGDTTVILTVPQTATVKTTTTTPAAEEDYGSDQVPVNGTLTLDNQDLSGSNAIYVMVTAQDGTTKVFYKITATESIIANGIPETNSDATAITNQTAKDAAVAAASDTSVDFANEAFAAAANAGITKNDAKTALVEASIAENTIDEDDVYIYAIPSLNVTANSFENGTYSVNIEPTVRIVASTASTAADVVEDAKDGTVNAVEIETDEEVTVDFAEPVSVDIGVPSVITASYVDIIHVGGGENGANKTHHTIPVTAGVATITVPHFSEFRISAANNAVLTELSLSASGTTVALDKPFDAGTTEYSATVGKDVTSVDVTATATGFDVKIDDGAVTANTATATVAITSNTTTVKVIVSGPTGAADSDKLTSGEYTITITRESDSSGDNNNNPGGTTSSGGGGGVSSNVTVSSATNGKVSVTPTAPSKGATVTINLTPDTGYQVGTVTVTDKDGNAVELTKVSDTQYTFTMPDGKVTVKATFTQTETPSATGFTDVAADAYYADAVKWAVDNGITNGLTATTFGPNNSCTRGQMVTFLWRAAGSPAATGTNSFSDVASGEYYYNAVLWAVEKGITNGTTSTTFSPNATVTRGQTVTFLYRYAESPAAEGTSSFTDVAADAFYADAVKWAVAEGITNGTSATTFAPSSNCTRGQIVTFLYRQIAE